MTKTMNTQGQGGRLSRRQFMGAAAATAAFTIVPSYVLGGANGTPPSGKLNIAGVGIGGMGQNNVAACAETENIVALCDVDGAYAAPIFKKYPNAKQWKDFRKMLDEQKDIDAVVVATPDHLHTPVAMAAMQRGKHVYVQKPLTRLVSEARLLTETARKYKVATQMGNQGHSGNGVRDICEWIWDGAIGEVKEVHAWTNRPVWPQGIDRPKDQPPVPPTLEWDLWVGPAPMRPYHPCYLPFNWRGWWDFGGGALADMACHVLDPVFSALKLKYASSVEASCTKVNNETFPAASTVHFEYPARVGMPAVKIHWYDGGRTPEKPEALGTMKIGQAASNVLFIGSKGVLRCGEYGDDPHLFPLELMKAYKRPTARLKRIPGEAHEQNWIAACKGGEPACSNFDYSGPLTEMVVMGNLALRPENVGKKLEWDGEKMLVTNDEKANDYVHMHYRRGWELKS